MAIHHNVVPRRIYLENINRVGDDRERSGGYADIYQGLLANHSTGSGGSCQSTVVTNGLEYPLQSRRTQFVALKRVRISQQTPKSEIDRLKKV